jgi:hypothetical protein
MFDNFVYCLYVSATALSILYQFIFSIEFELIFLLMTEKDKFSGTNLYSNESLVTTILNMIQVLNKFGF